MIADLLSVVSPPGEPRHARGDWGTVERALGTVLPADFKAMTERYGAGAFCDELVPATPFWAECPMAPAEDGFLVWATTGNGHRLAWRLADGVVVVQSPRGGELATHGGDATELVAAWLAGRPAGSLLGRRPGQAEGVAPWFEPVRERVHVTVFLAKLAEPTASTLDERVERLCAALASEGQPLLPRGRFRGRDGAAQDHFATVAGWRLTYDTAYGHNLRVSYPPADEPAVRAAVTRAAAALGVAIVRVLGRGGKAAWAD